MYRYNEIVNEKFQEGEHNHAVHVSLLFRTHSHACRFMPCIASYLFCIVPLENWSASTFWNILCSR